jgi:uncharacterized protein (DUF608 family)
MPMGSGAPLGGIGTGFVEIRADGCFHEWQIFNSGPWAMNARSTTAPPEPGPQYLRFVLRTKRASDEVAQVRRLYLRSDENDLYTLPFVQDIQSIDYLAWFPMTGLHYNDQTTPVRTSSRRLFRAMRVTQERQDFMLSTLSRIAAMKPSKCRLPGSWIIR